MNQKIAHRKFRFVKPLVNNYGEIPVNSEITIIGERLFFNGGMVDPYFYNFLMDLVYGEIENGFDYLEEIKMIYNKI